MGQGERREESAECDTERVRGCFMLFVLRIYGMDYGIEDVYYRGNTCRKAVVPLVYSQL